MSPLSATYWGIPAYVIFWALFAIAFGLFTQRAYWLFRLLRLGQKERRANSIGHRIKTMLVEVLPQWCNLKGITRKDRAGMGHALMFWGFSLFFIGYIIFIGLGEGFGLSPWLEGSTFETVYSSILDIAGLFVLLAIVWAAIRRYIIKPKRLEASVEAGVILLMIATLMVLHFCIEGFGYAAYQVQASWPPVGTALASFLTSVAVPKTTLIAVYKGVWWLHYVIILSFMVFIPRSKHLHILVSPLNIFFKSLSPKGALNPIDLETAETFGAARITDFTWKQLLDCYSCVICGQCQEVCPAYASGKPLNPKKLILDLKKHLFAVGPKLLKVKDKAEISSANPNIALVNKVITEDELWACTTCRACQEICPVSNEHIDTIIDLRRNLVLEQAAIPETAERALRSIEARGHPWRGATVSRTHWTEGLDIKTLADDSDIDILYWVGCTSALEDRSIKIAQATARVLKLAGVNFGILGAEESCCGEPARRLGNEYLFQIQAQKNIELLKSYHIKKIIASCAHCYNTIKNEYPHFGGDFEVIHHTEFLANLLEEGKLRVIKGNGGVVTYHDPCYLGRYNNIYQPPRQILNNIPDVTPVEMEQNRRSSFCCGGNAHTWLEERVGERISEIRLEQILDTGAQTVATACPFCLLMIDDAIKTRAVEKSLKVMDIAELIAEAAVYRPYPG